MLSNVRVDGGISETSLKLGFGKNLDICLARKEMTRNGPNMYHINTNNQLELELPVAISNKDVIQGMENELILTIYVLKIKTSQKFGSLDLNKVSKSLGNGK